MVFNCKISIAQCVQGNSENSQKVRVELLKMTKDDKNKEYLDQIYYAIAKMDLAEEDTSSAIENFKLSTEKSQFNDEQKAKSLETITVKVSDVRSAQLDQAATVPQVRHAPKRKLIVFLGTFLGGFVAFVYLIFSFIFSRQKNIS